MAQHFLLSAAARTLSLKTIFSEGEDAAYRRFRRLRWPQTDGAPVCPVCGCLDIYDLTTRRRFKCAACHHQFSGLCCKVRLVSRSSNSYNWEGLAIRGNGDAAFGGDQAD